MRRQRTSAADRRTARSTTPRATPNERRSAGRVGGWDGTLHEFVVQKPFCAPCRSRVFTALNPYAIPVLRYEEWVDKISIREAATLWKIELKTFENLKYGPTAISFLPTAQAARFYVPANRARWAAYLLRSNLLAIVKGNRWRSDSHADQLPKAWNKAAGIQSAHELEITQLVADLTLPGPGAGWVDSDCDSGNELWKQVQEIKAKAKEKRK